jgi:hypothetical protein
MTRNPARATLATHHVSALHAQLLGALAMGWALGGCFGGGPKETIWHNPSQTPPPEPPVHEGLCYGDAGVECYPLQLLDGLVADGGAPEATFTPEGCVDPETAQYAAVSCGPFPVSTGVRRGDTCCYYQCYTSPGCGRPFVIADEARVAEPRTSSDWLGDGRRDEPGVDAAIGREWLLDALAEHASVAAFSAFNLSLLALGAPAELVRASAAATLDEVHHARSCFELASQYGGVPLGPAPLAVNDLHIGSDLGSVVERAFLDGCIGETAAALVARASLDGCDAPRARAALERIAEDEARHAELAWQFVAWAVQRGGDAIARVLQTALTRAESDVRSTDTCRASSAAPPEWRRAGRLSDTERASLTRLATRDIARPMLEALLSLRETATSDDVRRNRQSSGDATRAFLA